MMKKLTTMLLVILLAINIPVQAKTQKAEAAVLRITVSEFAEQLTNEIGVAAEGSGTTAYTDALANKGIIKAGDFSDYSKDLTRGDMLMLLSRADDYLNSNSIEAELVKEVIDKRISDIGKVTETKREDIAKGFIKGFMKGYSNGKCAPDRNLKLTSKITKAGALSCIKMLKDKSLHAKISPDGQLIRTTNLPKYAMYFPYILASYPNSYYDWKFRYEGQAKVNPETGERIPYVYFEEYASPADIDKITNYENFKEVKAQYLDEWVNKVQNYMEGVFNVDYRTVDDEWVNKLLTADYSYGNENFSNRTKNEIESYIKKMKENKTVVESSKIAIDRSSLYFYRGSYVLRVYVKYKIVSSNVKYGADADTLINENPYGKILFTNYPLVNLNKFTLGEWKEGYFEVELSWYSKQNPENVGVVYAILNEPLYNKRKVN